jgi:hypothetical protein
VSASRPPRAESLAKRISIDDNAGMRLRSAIAIFAGGAAAVLPGAALGASSVGSHEQIAWVRRAASNFVGDELRGDGAGACSILNAPLRARQHRRTCTQQWNARLAGLLREPGGRAGLRAEARAISSAPVVVHGNSASIDLPSRLISGPNRFLWSENCWMLEG